MAKFASISRRNMLFTAGGGISGLALANLHRPGAPTPIVMLSTWQ